MNKKALIEERVKLHEENKALLDRAEKDGRKELSPDERSQYDAREARMAAIREDLNRVLQAEDEERSLGESRGRRTETEIRAVGDARPDDADMAFRAWAAGRRASEPMIAAAARLGVNYMAPTLDFAAKVKRGPNGEEIRSFHPVKASKDLDIISVQPDGESRALSIGTTTAGGNSVPNELMRAYYEVQTWYGAVREQSQVIRTESGATLPWPTVTDTSNTGEIIAEGNTATTTADPTFGVVNLGAFKFSSKAVYVSFELIQDSFVDLASYLGTALGRRIGRIQNNKFTVGAGTTESMGLITGATAGVTASATNAFTLDDLISLEHSVDLAYRNIPGAGYMMHDTIAKVCRQFKDGNGRYQWEMSTKVGQPDRLFGRPVYINNDMASALTTGQKLVAYGAYKLGFIVRDAGAVRFTRDESLRVLQDQVVFLAWQRSDSNVIDTTAIKYLQLG